VVVGDLIGQGSAQEQSVVGETPNLAARLQGLAEPDAVVIAAGTRRLVGDLFEYRDLGAVDVKGIAGPVPMWQVLRPSVSFGRREAFLFLTLLGSLLGGVWGAPASAQDAKLVIFAAASLKDALDEVNAAYQRDKGQETTTSYAASSTLAKQIEAAAPADVFISADLDWMDYLAKRNLIKAETRTNLLGNRLVLIAPVNSPVELSIGPNFPLAQAGFAGKDHSSPENLDI
jgi:hypothetical protein